MSHRFRFSAVSTSRSVLIAALPGLCLAAICCQPALAQSANEDPFALGVRNSEPVTAEQQLSTFTVPEGFAIQLVASEPEIDKPMNLAFDSQGRMWVSSSLEYPFAAAKDAVPRDSIRILEDTNGDARADKVTVFADKLNIPIGLIPYGDGVICFAIPNIWYLRDTDGDNICDKREVLYGPFDTSRDTHGMCNAFRMGDDGWIYACHGFNNRSEVTGRDGHKVTLSSGNTFRFRPDGSRIEMYTQGQVNPFGMSIDSFGDIFTADCHTKPVTLLLPGGCYDSFGRPHDGLGYVPNVMEHLHGSTAIAALALGQHLNFPKEYSNSTFDGNVMTSRVNRNNLVRTGSSVKAFEQPDLVSSTDPWFRPVDLVAGPDGALYVADFYNRIIGHYEVDLLHPGRDRFRGRIWRVCFLEQDTEAKGPNGYGLELKQKSASQLMEVIRSAPEMQKRLARDVLAGDLSPATTATLRTALADNDPAARRFALRLLSQRNAITAVQLQNAMTDSDETVRVHVMRLLRELSPQAIDSNTVTSLIRQGFADFSPMVRRAAAAAASTQQSQELLSPLLRMLHTTALNDVHLRHSIRIALRDNLRNDDRLRWLGKHSPLTMDKLAIADLCLALKTAAAAEFVAGNLQLLGSTQPAKLADYLQFAAVSVSPDAADQIVAAIRERFAGDLNLQQQLLGSMRSGFAERNQNIPESVHRWAIEVVLQLLKIKSLEDLDVLDVPASISWNYSPHSTSPNPDNCWTITTSRMSSDGVAGAALLSSFEKGETRTGIYRSAPFEPAASLSFFLAGHDGFPDKPLKKANFVRLIDVATSEILREASPLRNDVAQFVEWNTADLIGRTTAVELIDGDNGTAYAWLAVGRFSIGRLNPSDSEQRRIAAAEMIGDFQLGAISNILVHLVTNPESSRATRVAAGEAFSKLQPGSLVATAAMVPSIASVSDSFATTAMEQLLNGQEAEIKIMIEQTFGLATAAEQLRLAEQLASDRTGAEELLRLMESGKASARLLLRPTIQQRLKAIGTDSITERVASLQEKLPAEDAIVEKLLKDRKALMTQDAGDVASGKELFRKNCMVCHQIGGEGKQIGPNLDGIANRGLDRMLEDVLAPNRNVDVAFRTTTVVTSDGKAYSGLLKELEGNRISLVDSQAKETILQTDQVEERVPSSLSPMPANVAEILTETQFRDLMTYLLQQKRLVETGH